MNPKFDGLKIYLCLDTADKPFIPHRSSKLTTDEATIHMKY